MEFTTSIDEETGEPIVDVVDALPCFFYKSGYVFEAIDLGIHHGVKITMSYPHEHSTAILFPPEKTEELGQWLLKSMGLTVPRLPQKLEGLLQRVIDSKDKIMPLKRSDKNMAKDAIKTLKWFEEGA